MRTYDLGSTIVRDYDLLRKRLKEYVLQWKKPALVQYQEREGLVSRRIRVDGHLMTPARTPPRHRSITRAQYL